MTQRPTILELLSMAELEELENLTGQRYTEIFSKEGMSARAGYSLHWILSKRNNQQADIQVSKSLSLIELNQFFNEYVDNPKQG